MYLDCLAFGVAQACVGAIQVLESGFRFLGPLVEFAGLVLLAFFMQKNRQSIFSIHVISCIWMALLDILLKGPDCVFAFLEVHVNGSQNAVGYRKLGILLKTALKIFDAHSRGKYQLLLGRAKEELAVSP